ncbi:MAG: PAS domain-containing protein [Methylococcaceae bacterium]
MSYKTNPRYLQLQEELRERAKEKMLIETDEALENYSFDELSYELQVYRIELEMQNENLRKAQELLEQSRLRYTDLYDLAPTSYLTLNADGIITEINFTGTLLFGMQRGALVNQDFASIVADEDVDCWKSSFDSMKKDRVKKQCHLMLKRSGAVTFNAHLNYVFVESTSEMASLIRMAIIDISVD